MDDVTRSTPPPSANDSARSANSSPPFPDITQLTGKLPPRNLAVGDEVARGGMGAVLFAQDLNIQRSVAIKVVLPDKQISAENLLRFIGEARVTGQLEHPGIVPIYDLGTDDNGQPFYTMKFVKGVTLKEIIAKLADGDKATVEKYTPGHLLMVFQKVCDAIAFAHSKGVVHRDLKPENIMLGDYGEVMVMDWGLAKVMTQTDQQQTEGKSVVQSARATATGDSSIYATMDGEIMGTPQFMAPEQAEGQIKLIDARTDIYALGAILYNLLTLEPPITGKTVEEVLEKARQGAIVPPAQRSPAPEALSAVAMKAMAKAQADRYQSVPELQRDIEAYQTGFATSAENAGAWRQFSLFIQRNKAVSIAVAASVLVLTGVVTGFVIKVTAERNRATAALANLKATAPTYYAQALALVKEGKFEEALRKVSFAVEREEQNPQYHYLKGNLHQSLLQLAEARDEYATAVKLDNTHTRAAANLKLCEKLLRDNQGQEELRNESRQELANAMRVQERFEEAFALMQKSDNRNKSLLETCRASLRKAGIKVYGISLNTSGQLDLNLFQSGITNLSALRGMPLGILRLEGVPVTDLSPLQGMPLTALEIRGTKVTHLDPIKGMPLKWLWAPEIITDLSPLAGMPLETLILRGARVRNLSPLKGGHLRYLDIDGLQCSDLSPLVGQPLKHLSCASTTVSDLSPLTNMPLETLMAGKTKVRDLSPLKGAPLKSLDLSKTSVTDLRPLSGMPLESLVLDETAVNDLEPLRGMPLRTLYLKMCTNVRDLGPLASCTRLEDLVIPREATNIDALRRLPKLKHIGFHPPGFGKYFTYTVSANFWRTYDAKKRAQSLIVSPAADGSFTLPAKDAMFDGNVIFLDGKGAICRWADADDRISWRIAVNKPAAYVIQLTYSCEPKEAGSEYTVNAGNPSVSGKVTPTSDWEDYQTVNVGTLKIEQAGTITILLRSTKIPHENVMNLRQLKLEPK